MSPLYSELVGTPDCLLSAALKQVFHPPTAAQAAATSGGEVNGLVAHDLGLPHQMMSGRLLHPWSAGCLSGRGLALRSDCPAQL